MPITTALAVSFAALALVALVQHIQIRRIKRQIREGFQRTEDALNKKAFMNVVKWQYTGKNIDS